MSNSIRSIDDIERDQLTSPFGKDLGLLHELLIQGRKQNVGRAFWRLLQEDKTVFQRAIEAALTFPTYECSLENMALPMDELLDMCAQPTREFAHDGYHLLFDNHKNLEADECAGITYDNDTLRISLFPASRQTGLRDIEQQIAGLYFRPARLKEMLLLALQHRNPDWPSSILCLQKTFLGRKEVRVGLQTRRPKGVSEYSILAHHDVTDKSFMFDPMRCWTAIPVIQLPRV